MTPTEQKAFDAMREALEQMIACHDEPTCPAITTATEALTAANAVSVEALITVESSLRFRLECEQQKSADLLDEVRELKEKLFKTPQPQAQADSLELQGIEETIAEGQGFWVSCTGCFETNEGHPPPGSFFSKVFKCHLGNGCRECGGIGAIWDNTDYDAMAKFLMQQDANPQATEPAAPEAK